MANGGFAEIAIDIRVVTVAASMTLAKTNARLAFKITPRLKRTRKKDGHR